MPQDGCINLFRQEKNVASVTSTDIEGDLTVIGCELLKNEMSERWRRQFVRGKFTWKIVSGLL